MQNGGPQPDNERYHETAEDELVDALGADTISARHRLREPARRMGQPPDSHLMPGGLDQGVQAGE